MHPPLVARECSLSGNITLVQQRNSYFHCFWKKHLLLLTRTFAETTHISINFDTVFCIKKPALCAPLIGGLRTSIERYLCGYGVRSVVAAFLTGLRKHCGSLLTCRWTLRNLTPVVVVKFDTVLGKSSATRSKFVSTHIMSSSFVATERALTELVYSVVTVFFHISLIEPSAIASKCSPGASNTANRKHHGKLLTYSQTLRSVLHNET